MLKIILNIIMFLIILAGVILVYDARSIIKKFFSFGDQNEGALGLKLIGGILIIASGIALVFIQRL